jgi:hypothetical protein
MTDKVECGNREARDSIPKWTMVSENGQLLNIYKLLKATELF